MITPRVRWIAVGFVGLVGLVDGPRAQENRCVACHFETAAVAEGPQQRTAQAHLDEWDTSMHAASDVSCDSCHRGDPEATDLIDAHQDVLSPTNPASPVNVNNIPETCGSCHLGQLAAFRTSRHAQLLASGDQRVPQCATCHGSVAARLPSTRGITSKCVTCHGPAGVAPLSEHQELVRLMRERILEHRYSLALVRTVIENTRNPDRRAELVDKHDEAAAPLTAAVEAWHAFAFDRAAAPLALAGTRIGALVQELTPQ